LKQNLSWSESSRLGLSSHFHPGGWIHWPDDEDISLEFLRLLGAAQEGGSTVSECFLTAARINPADEESWHREWKKTADASNARGDAALTRGNVLTAQANWLRAMNYYRAAAFHFDEANERGQAAISSMQTCARRYLQHLTPAGEIVEIPWLDEYTLQGYFLPAPSGPGRSPVVVCIGEPGHRKEEHLYKMARYARERGMSMLAVDLMGWGTGAQFEKIAGRPHLETVIGSVMDYVTSRNDADHRRIAIVGDGAGSSFVARGVALDGRFAAAVCDGGIWDLQERTFLMSRAMPRDPGFATRSGNSIARKLGCPVLVTVGEHGWLVADHVIELFGQLQAAHRDISLKIFTGAETAASQGHADNPTLANELIFDWIADRLKQRIVPSPELQLAGADIRSR
jgi:dienelactone hydrolase